MPNISGVIADYLVHLAVERALAKNSLSAYRGDLERYGNFLQQRGITGLSDVTEQDVAQFPVYLRTPEPHGIGLSAGSAGRALIAVRGLHKFAAAENLVPSNVAGAVRPPAVAKRLPKALDLHVVEAIIEAAGASGEIIGLRDTAIVELLYATGARISEVVGLDRDDFTVGPEGASVRLRGKGNKDRVVPVGSVAVQALDAYLVRARPALAVSGKESSAIFLNTRGKRLSRQSAWALLKEAALRTGLPAASEVSPHALRHSFATHLLQGGADVRVVQELLGHASVTTTQLYTLVTIDSLREVYSQAHPRARSSQVN